MVRTRNAQLLYLPPTAEARFLPEGPTALDDGRFSWVAIQHGPQATTGSLNIFNFQTGLNQSFNLPGRPGFAKPTSRPGQFVIGCERQLGIFDIADQSWRVLCDGIDQDVTGTIINDGTSFGDNLVFGTKDLEFKTPKAGLYLFRGRDRQLIRLRSDQICSNGKDVVSSGSGGLHLLDIDSPTRAVVRYRLDIEAGRLTEPERIIDLSDLESFPDGMVLTPDEQSAIISFYNPNPAQYGETRQYGLLDGKLEAIWRTPGSPQATCPLLIDHPDGSVKLVITTAVEHMSAQRQVESKLAGGLFIAETHFRHAPASGIFHWEE
ncbi:MAG: SMP-30/gluconolactonase/LRE family protein [Pirellulaceae bacterium]|nr:SMP-30/gluconolactonase/LRE family protein [Pirellulaceae bacterium]